MKFTGMWHIRDMDMWDEDYLNMEVQAYIEIESDNCGAFQFGLVSGEIDGDVVEIKGKEIFFFSWEGNDECDPASGVGWCCMKDDNTLEGRIHFHMGDRSGFRARRI